MPDELDRASDYIDIMTDAAIKHASHGNEIKHEGKCLNCGEVFGDTQQIYCDIYCRQDHESRVKFRNR